MTRARFFYDLNSPYSYFAAHRVDDIVPGDVEWMPIAFGPLLVATRRVPWSLGPEREQGQRDCERRAAAYGLPPIRWPEGWPGESYSVGAARAALVAKHEGRVREMTRALFAQVFVEGARLDVPATIEAAAAEAGIEGITERIADPAIKQELRDRTDEAMALGVVGVPTVEVGGRLLWGDDRLEEAAAA